MQKKLYQSLEKQRTIWYKTVPARTHSAGISRVKLKLYEPFWQPIDEQDKADRDTFSKLNLQNKASPGPQYMMQSVIESHLHDQLKGQ